MLSGAFVRGVREGVVARALRSCESRGLGRGPSTPSSRSLRELEDYAQDDRPFLRAYFLSSTSTYSASITPSSFFLSPSGAWPLAVASGVGPPAVPGAAWLALSICSASLCEAECRGSR